MHEVEHVVELSVDSEAEREVFQVGHALRLGNNGAVHREELDSLHFPPFAQQLLLQFLQRRVTSEVEVKSLCAHLHLKRMFVIRDLSPRVDLLYVGDLRKQADLSLKRGCWFHDLLISFH